MKKDTFNYNMRLFYERWKWFFVNAYFIIGIALLVLVIGFVGNGNKDMDVAQTTKTEKEIIEAVEQKKKPVKEQDIEKESVEQKEVDVQTQSKKEITGESAQENITTVKSYVLVNEDAMADKVSGAMLVMVKDTELCEVKREIDDETIDYIYDKAKDEKINVFVIGDSYVISEASYNVFLENENIEAERLAGVDMQKTLLCVLDYIKDNVDFSKVYVANIVNADSCDYAFEMVLKYKIPVLPVDYSGVSGDVISIVDEYGVKEVEFIGGEIGADTKKKFEDIVGSENIKG